MQKVSIYLTLFAEMYQADSLAVRFGNMGAASYSLLCRKYQPMLTEISDEILFVDPHSFTLGVNHVSRVTYALCLYPG